MRWPVFAAILAGLLVIQHGLATLMEIGGATPWLGLVLVVFVGLHAPGYTVAWSFLIVGVLADLMTAYPAPEGYQNVALLGPNALGALLAGYAVLQLRSLVYRDATLTTAFLVFVTGLMAHLVATLLLVMRGLPWLLAEPLPGWHASDALVDRFFDLLYTTVVAFPLIWLLQLTTPLWGFADPKLKAGMSRR